MIMSIDNLNNLITKSKKGLMISKKDVDKFYSSYTWQKSRGATLERDDYLCQVCIEDGEPIPADTVHHIVHLRDDPSKALDDDNLISVCRDCHSDLHSETSRQNNETKKLSKRINVFEVKKNPNKIW